MSRIIKASVWDEAPRIVEVPAPESSPEDLDGKSKKGRSKALTREELEAEIIAEIKLQEKEEFSRIEMERHKLEGEKKSFEDEKEAAREELDKQRKKLERDTADFETTRDAIMADLVTKKRDIEDMQNQTRAECGIKLSEANQEKQNILDDAHQQADSIREDARKKGHEEGLAEGREQGAREIREEQKQIIADANAKAEKTIADSKEEAHQYVLDAENEIAKLAMYAVEKILPQHFIDMPTVILPVIRKALLKVKDQPEVILRVAPSDYDLALMARQELQGLLEGNAVLTVHSDDNLKQGDSILETPNGNVDARISTQIETIKKALMDVMK